MKFLECDPAQTMTRAERNKRFRSYLYNSVLQHSDNRLARFLSNGNRGTDERPLTIDQLTKSIFANFLHSNPVGDNLGTDEYKRDNEIENIVGLSNMIHDLALHSWNSSAGKNDQNQIKLARLFGSKSMMAWTELLKDAVCGKLDLNDTEDREMPLYRELSDQDLGKLKKIVEKLMNHKIWSSPPNSDIDRVLSDNKSAVKEWLRKQGLTTGYLMGARV